MDLCWELMSDMQNPQFQKTDRFKGFFPVNKITIKKLQKIFKNKYQSVNYNAIVRTAQADIGNAC